MRLLKFILGFGILLPLRLWAIDTVQNGNWNNPATWQGGLVPGTNAEVRLLHVVQLNVNATTGNLTVETGGQLILVGGNLEVNGLFRLLGQMTDGNGLGQLVFNQDFRVEPSGNCTLNFQTPLTFRGNLENRNVFRQFGNGTVLFNGANPQQINPVADTEFRADIVQIAQQLTIRNGAALRFTLGNTFEIFSGARLLNENQNLLRIDGHLTGGGLLTNAALAIFEYQNPLAPQVNMEANASQNQVIYRANQNQELAATTYFHLILQNIGTSNQEKSLVGEMLVEGDLTVQAGLQGQTLLNPGAFGWVVLGNTLFEQNTAFVDNDPSGLLDFQGELRLIAGAVFLPSVPVEITIRGDFFQGGAFALPAGSLLRLLGNNRNIFPQAEIRTAGSVEIEGQRTLQAGELVSWEGPVIFQTNAVLRNQNPNGLLFGTPINANDNTASLVNEMGAVIFFRPEGLPFSNLNTDFSAPGNIVVYDRQEGTGNQTIAPTQYQNLRLAGTGTKTLGGAVTVHGLLTSERQFDVSPANYPLTLQGNWQNEAGFEARQGRVIFSGSQDQQLTGIPLQLYEAELQKNGGTLGPQVLVEIIGRLFLSQGFWESLAAQPLTFRENATSDPGQASAFVRGPITKIGSADFIFPLGAGSVSAPLGLRGLNQSGSFTVAYFRTAPPTANLAPALVFLSAVEYWQVQSNTPGLSAGLELFWTNGAASGITDLTDLSVAQLSSGIWNEVESQASGSVASGQIRSTNNLSNFGDFTFASREARNALGNTDLIPSAPEWGEVRVEESGAIQVRWVDLASQETEYIVERATGSEQNFSVLQTLPRNQTELLDTTPIAGTPYFYRVRAQNPFGSAISETRGALVGVLGNLPSGSAPLLKVYPNPNTGVFWVEGAGLRPEDWIILDGQGLSVPFARQATPQGWQIKLLGGERGVIF
ncbi:MAG: fibronectin type III domain-containing protein [Microscillaceae bacterium]|nr:fibronectin type III domain-containing protein [Microscillaceae bacterium]